MNKRELECEMKRYGDIGETLAKHLGITRTTLSRKINGKAEFTQGEISAIKERYQLSAERIDAIFFSETVS